ncbi:MAG: hypothetical protein JSU09_00245 [Bacteroidetes bacterium]|nr:hypothetical protein [Bacteroidota bacterium]
MKLFKKWVQELSEGHKLADIHRYRKESALKFVPYGDKGGHISVKYSNQHIESEDKMILDVIN